MLYRLLWKPVNKKCFQFLASEIYLYRVYKAMASNMQQHCQRHTRDLTCSSYILDEWVLRHRRLIIRKSARDAGDQGCDSANIMHFEAPLASLLAMSLLSRAAPMLPHQSELQNRTDTIFQAALAGSFAGLTSILDLYQTWHWCATAGPNVTFRDREDMPLLTNSLCQVWTHNTTLILARKMMDLKSTKDIIKQACVSKSCSKEAAKVGREAMAIGMFIGLPVLSAGNRTLNGSVPAKIFDRAVHATIRSLIFANGSHVGTGNFSNIIAENATSIDVGNGTSTHTLARRGFRSRTGRFLRRTRDLARDFSSMIQRSLKVNVKTASLHTDLDPDPDANSHEWIDPLNEDAVDEFEAPNEDETSPKDPASAEEAGAPNEDEPSAKDPASAEEAKAPKEAKTPDRIAETGPIREEYLANTAKLQAAAERDGDLAARFVRVSRLEDELRRSYKTRLQWMRLSSQQQKAVSLYSDRTFKMLRDERNYLRQRGFFKDPLDETHDSHKLFDGQRGFFNDVPGEDLDPLGRNWQYGVSLSQEAEIAPEDVERLGMDHNGRIMGEGTPDYLRGRELLLSFDPSTEQAAGDFFADHNERIGAKSTRLFDTVSIEGNDLILQFESEDRVDDWLEWENDEDGIKSGAFDHWLDTIESVSDVETTELPDEWRNGEIPDLDEPESFYSYDSSMERYSLANDGEDDIWDAADYDIEGVIDGEYDGEFDTDGKAFSDTEVDYGRGKAKGIKGAQGKGRAGKGKGKVGEGTFGEGKFGAGMDGAGEAGEMAMGEMGEGVGERIAKAGVSGILRDIVMALGAL
nr:hypothetical protein CFP56_28593 [Quercus suber]